MPVEPALGGQIETCRWGDPAAPDVLIALHAAASAPRAFTRLARELIRPGLQIVAPALNGYGDTMVEVAGDPVAQHGAVAEWVLERHRGSGQTYLFGHSMGGLVALNALAARARVNRAALFEPIVLSCLDLSRADHRAGLAWDRDAVDGLNAAVASGSAEDGLAGFIRAWNETEWSTLPAELREQLLGRAASLAAETQTVSYYAFPLPSLQRITVPVTVLHGAKSPPVSALIAAELSERLDCACTQELADTGHMGPVFAARAVAHCLRAWFNRP
ncbi:MAG: alpha/beta hydrolase [Pseudomonadota bacterium]